VSELGASVGFSVDGADLIELLRNIFGDKLPSSFGQNENVVLFFKELGNLLVVVEVGWLQGRFHSQTKLSNISNNILSDF